MAPVEACPVAVEPMNVEPADDGCTKNGGVLNSPFDVLAEHKTLHFSA